jgi:hypothetical protein
MSWRVAPIAFASPRRPRGQTEAADGEHLHCDHHDLRRAARFRAFAADAVVDIAPMHGADADSVLAATSGTQRLLALSSMDVYRAYEGFRRVRALEPLPLTEVSPVRRRHL